MSLPKQQRLLASLNDPADWGITGKPDAILFSGGGDDIAGDQFCIYLDYAAQGSSGLNAARFADVLGSVMASYFDLFAFRDRYAPGVPILGHGYDFPFQVVCIPCAPGPGSSRRWISAGGISNKAQPSCVWLSRSSVRCSPRWQTIPSTILSSPIRKAR